MIICCGEALIDMLPRKLEDGSESFMPVSGGAVFNTAIGLGRLGVATGFVSGISTDFFGEQLIESLEESNVSTDLCVRNDQPSTLAFVKLSDGQAKYLFFDENSAGRSLTVDSLPSIPNDCRAMHFGAISLIPEPCGSSYEALMMREHTRRVISLDPNIRPGFIKDAQAHRARLSRMIEVADIVKVSDEDLLWLADGDGALAADLPRQWVRAGRSVVLLTKGAEGCEVFTSSQCFDVPAVKAKVVDTVGAGDTFNSGFLLGLLNANLLDKSRLAKADQSKLRSAVALAAKVAAVTVSRAGANPPFAHEF